MSDFSDLPDSSMLQAISAEMERIVGAQTENGGAEKFFWLLPLASDAEFLTLLRQAETGIGAAGLRQFFLDRLGTVAGLTPVTKVGSDSVDRDEADYPARPEEWQFDSVRPPHREER